MSHSPFQALLAPGSTAKLTAKQRKALEAAERREKSASKKAAQMKANVAGTGGMLACTAETQGALFLSSLTEGYFGPARQKAVNWGRGLVGVGGVVTGLGMALFDKTGAKHVLAVSNGVLGSLVATAARDAGTKLAQKRAASAATAASPALQGHPTPPYPELPDLIHEATAAEREVVLTPSTRKRGPRPSPGRGRGRRG